MATNKIVSHLRESITRAQWNAAYEALEQSNGDPNAAEAYIDKLVGYGLSAPEGEYITALIWSLYSERDEFPIEPTDSYGRLIVHQENIADDLLDAAHSAYLLGRSRHYMYDAVHTVRGKAIGPEGSPYGVTHDFDCPGCVNTPFTASPRSESYWSS